MRLTMAHGIVGSLFSGVACAGCLALVPAVAQDPAKAAAQDPVKAARRPEIRVEESELGRRVTIDGELFVEYRHAGWREASPILYPVLGPGGVSMTRHFPMKDGVPGEAKDHLHHRSIWFAHGAVNGADFWAGTQSEDVIRHRRYVPVEDPDREQRTIHTQNDWVTRDGKIVCTDDRWLVFGASPKDGARFIDYTITVHASHGDLLFGDTKEGTMALRVHPALRLKGEVAKGSILNSEGHRDGKAWGKRAKWVAYWGPVEDRVVGLAMFDHPQNLRHPCWWHARDYGLVAANPFGAHDFENAERGTGDFELAAEEDLTFRYRIVFFRGTADEARVAERYRSFAEAREPAGRGNGEDRCP